MKKLLILAMATSFCVFAQDATNDTQEQPSAQNSFITDELTGNKVFETAVVHSQTTQVASDEESTANKKEDEGSAITSEAKEEKNKDNTGNPKPSGTTNKTNGKTTTSQKKTQGSKNTSSSSKKSTTKSSNSKKTSGTSTKSSSKKTSTKTTGAKTSGGKKSTQGKTATKTNSSVGTQGGKTQQQTNSSDVPKQEKQDVQGNVQSTAQNPAGKPVSDQQTQTPQAQDTSLPLPDSTTGNSAENLKTKQASQNPKKQEDVQNKGKPQKPTTPSPTASASGGNVAGAAALPSSPDANNAPQEQKKASEEHNTTVPKSTPAAPSCFVSMKNSQYLDVTYPESGWIFLGEEGEKQLLRYFGRKIAGDVTSFSLRSRSEGKTLLHFYKNTADGVIDDYIEVEIKGKNENQERAKVAPYTPQPAKSTGADTAVPQARAQTKGEDIGSVDMPQPDEAQTRLFDIRMQDQSHLLHEAKRLAHLEDYDEALRLLDEFLDGAQQNADEALFLQAQIFEVSQEQKNIRGALDCYETIVTRYPESSFWDKANERAVYLKKFYFDIR